MMISCSRHSFPVQWYIFNLGLFLQSAMMVCQGVEFAPPINLTNRCSKRVFSNVSQDSNSAILGRYLFLKFQGGYPEFALLARIWLILRHYLLIHALTYRSSPLIRNPEMYSIYFYLYLQHLYFQKDAKSSFLLEKTSEQD